VLADPDLFLRLHDDKVVIDEAQLAPALFSALRVAIDRDRTEKRPLCPDGFELTRPWFGTFGKPGGPGGPG